MINWSTTDIAGIEFGDHHVAAVRVRGKGEGALTLTHAGFEEYDAASASPKAISEVVRALWKKSGMPTKTVCASLRSGSLVLRYFSLPPMTVTELKRSLELKAEEALQMSASEIVVEWHLDEASQGGGGVPLTGLLAAAPVKDVERELDVLYDAGLDPVILDVRALAVANLYQVMGSDVSNPEPVCLVNMAQHSADVMVRGRGGQLYPHAIYCRASAWSAAPGFLAENIRDVLRYTEYKLGWDPAIRVVFTGTIPDDESFFSVLKESLGTGLECWDPVTGISRKSKAVTALLSCKAASAGLLAPALGLALRRS